jgi:DNA-binding NtrC family response regulator
LLVEYFAGEFARHLNRSAPSIDPEVIAYLQHYDWPGNVRELEHLVQRAVLLCKDNLIRRQDVAVPSPGARAEVGTAEGMLEIMLQQGNGSPAGDLLERAEEILLRLALTQAQGNKSRHPAPHRPQEGGAPGQEIPARGIGGDAQRDGFDTVEGMGGKVSSRRLLH